MPRSLPSSKTVTTTITEEQYACVMILVEKNGSTFAHEFRQCLDTALTESVPYYAKLKAEREKYAKIRATELLAVHFKTDPADDAA